MEWASCHRAARTTVGPEGAESLAALDRRGLMCVAGGQG